LATISLVYGNAIGRLFADGVAISSALTGLRSHACGLFAATSENFAQIAALSAWPSASVCPSEARRAFS
jgi:hypothetical protein